MEPMNESLTDLLPAVTEDPEKSTALKTAGIVAATAVVTTLGWIGVGKVRDLYRGWRDRRAERVAVVAEPSNTEDE